MTDEELKEFKKMVEDELAKEEFKEMFEERLNYWSKELKNN